MENFDFGLLEGIFTTVVVVLGGMVYKFWSLLQTNKHEINKKKLRIESETHSDHQNLIKEIYDKVYAQLEIQLNKYEQDIISYKEDIGLYKEENTKQKIDNEELTRKLSEAVAQTLLQEKQIQLLEKQVKEMELEIDRLRKRIASQQGVRPCSRCETPKRCGYGMDCPYEV